VAGMVEPAEILMVVALAQVVKLAQF